MLAGFRMKRDIARPCFCKVRNDSVDRLNHQVNIDRCLDAVVTQCIADHRPDCQVGHEMIVHHVKMHDVGARIEHSFDILAQAGEIGGENRRSN